MQFHSRDAIGKAGERAVEEFVESKLNFVYRKVGLPDIGIDGEIEILDGNRSSTGGFLKVQVKTTEASLNGKRTRVAIDEEHLDYFNSLTVQPILAVASIIDKKIWWKPILHKENYRGPRNGFGIHIDPKTDEMTRSSARLLRMIGERSNAMIAKYLIEEIQEHLTDIDDAENSGNYDIITVDAWVNRIISLEKTMRDAECLLKYERRYSSEITKIERAFAAVGERIQERKAWFDEHEVWDTIAKPTWE